MTDDRSLERAARSWLEVGPTQAPPRAVEAALLQIETTSQERDLRIPWRFPTMSTPARVAAAAVIGVLAAGGALFVLQPGRSSVGGPGPTPTPSPSPTTATSPAQVIPDGIYFGTTLQVAAILEQLAGDPTMNSAEKDAIIDSVLRLRGATTYQTRVEVLGSAMTVSGGVDGVFVPESWTIRPIDDKRIAARVPDGTSEIEFEIRGCGLPGSSCGFTFQAMSPAPSPVEAFVRRLIFEQSGPFIPAS